MPMPRFNEFNEGFRNHRILFWIHLLDRGIGIVYEKDWSPFVKDPWHFDENQKMIQKIIMRRRYHEQNIDNRLKILEKVQNYLGTITFPDLAPELRQKYKELAAVQKYEGLEEEFDRGKFYTKMKKVYSDRLEKILDVVQKENGLSRKQIGKRIGISPQLLSRIDDDE
jgi:DNA-directed RNA polymerase specialized sigma subunit